MNIGGFIFFHISILRTSTIAVKNVCISNCEIKM